MRFWRLLIFLFLLTADVLQAQQATEMHGVVLPCVVVEGDTLPFICLPESIHVSSRIFKNRRAEDRYRRLVHNVRKAYPYAKLAGEKYREYDSILAQETNTRRRDKLMKMAEKDIKKQFEKELRKLTISQGKILVKLIDRETSHSAFLLVKDLRNSFQAYLYQGIGRLFGYNLKTKYDPFGRDRAIEGIVVLIERGELKPLSINAGR